ncbi:MAG: diphthine--ammonia ligase [Euryarchaeota archaeon]|nr:diphthine--ammonia ligase [Euryarchaeota archaeon]MDE1837915.1 diphthine--ammonia ligase [Euryarchaeota archaeon]MDE1881265.1 diphthine--ammonia ligase [Euryarchaeota archaeon]MDE2046247.1 diphthine--ammonia ligase [Thermoplasmata archaeon]
MKFAALVSGGKDSLHAASLLENWGWTAEELITLEPSEPDAWMFHTPNLRWVPLLAQAWKKKHHRVPVEGKGEEAELEALETALEGVKHRGLKGVSVGAVASSYQWSRIHRVAYDVGVEVFSPLWRVDPRRVVQEEIGSGLDIRISHVATEALSAELLGQRLDEKVLETLEERSKKVREFNVAGEGGEFETFVVGAPFFRGRVSILSSHVEAHGSSSTWVIDGARWTR